MQNTGFVGLGTMGRPMAQNLLGAGVPLWVHDVNPEAAVGIAQKGAQAATPAEMAEHCEVIFAILPNGQVTQQVLFGEGGLAGALRPGTLVVDMSSVQPEESKACAAGLADLGCMFLDAPVSGGEPKAVDGTLAFMVGGAPEAYQRALPFFHIMGDNAVLVGDTGAGSLAKLANQIIVNTTIAAVSEAMVFAAKAGADPQKVFEAIRGGLAGSAVLEAKVPMMLRRDFKPGGTLAINRKDIGNVLAAAHAAEAPVPMSAQLYEMMQALAVMGRMGDDHSAIVKYYQRLAGTEVHPREGQADA